MSTRRLWERYAACWSQRRDQRAEGLASAVTEDVVYRDPATVVEGIAGLSDYMDSFRQAFPAGRFVIDSVDQHHGRSLARWRQLDPDGETHQRGASFAAHAGDDRLLEITGFFSGAPDLEESGP